jgi:hypothetical protein
MKKLEISKKQEIIGGYDVWMCSWLGAFLAISNSWGDLQFIQISMLYDAYDCII